MQTITMPARSDITMAAVLEAIKAARNVDVASKKVKFVELMFAPEAEICDRATDVGHRLLETGVGVKLSVDWGFLGTSRWAIQTENARVVNEGLKIGV